MGEIVFGVSQGEVGVRDRLPAVANIAFLRDGNPGRPLNHLQSSFSPCQADKVLVEMVQPWSQNERSISRGKSRERFGR